MIKIAVSSGGYPVHLRLIDESGYQLSLSHKEMLQLENALAEAKQHVLCNLPRNLWHEVDPKLAGVA